ncbi:YcgJ family protein [Pseudomonas sp. ZL2]
MSMNKSPLLLSLALLLAVGVMPAQAKQRAALKTPVSGVLCDRYVCANDKGISRELTEKYLGKKAATTDVFTSSDVDLTEFTFANGIFCDVKERLCREDRYYGANGERSGVISKKYTKALFGE